MLHQTPSVVPVIAAVIFLLLAVFGRWPYGFYTFLRIVVCGSAIYIAFQASVLKNSPWVWLMGGLAILFNPLIPVYLARSHWRVINLVTAVLFAASILALHPKK